MHGTQLRAGSQQRVVEVAVVDGLETVAGDEWIPIVEAVIEQHARAM